MAAVGGTKDAALFIGAVGMAFGGDEEAVWILRIDENRRDLLSVAKVLHVRPGFTRVGGFIDSVAGGEIRALQSFAAADVNNVRIGRGDGESADGAGGLIVENGIPGVAEVRGFPDAAVDGGHVEHIGLMRNARDGDGAASAERADAAPAHFGEEFLIELLRACRSAKNNSDDDSSAEPLPCCVTPHSATHPAPPRNGRGYLACGNGAMRVRRTAKNGCATARAH